MPSPSSTPLPKTSKKEHRVSTSLPSSVTKQNYRAIGKPLSLFSPTLNITSAVTGGGGAKVEVNRVFIAAGCNRIVNNVSWGACDFISFGARNAVAIFCPKTAQILITLPGHKASVNCTYWLPCNKFAFKAKHLERHYLLSGDTDGVIILWEFSLADIKWRHVLQLPQSHNITGVMVSESNAIFASTSSDGNWKWSFHVEPVLRTRKGNFVIYKN